MLNIVCVKWGDLYGPEYVNILYDMVRRNLMEGYPGKFICYTDNPEGLDAGIEARELPKELEGWWGKLWLFSQHKERTLFLDLDTVIVGALDGIVEHDGPLAILRDFYRPNGLQSSVMLWNGDYSFIWDAWCEAGQPRLQGGDQEWIEHVLFQGYEYSLWQDAFPGDFVSYKAHGCEKGFPKGSKVVVFHGLPRPHQCDGWVKKVWKMGGGTTAELMVIANVPEEQILRNRAFNTMRDLPDVVKQEPRGRRAAIVAGGPSLSDDLEELALFDGDIFTVNGTLKYLMGHGITPDFQVMLDARPENIEFLNGADVTYLMCSQVDPSLLDALEDKTVLLWHSALPGCKPMPMQIGGATTVGLKAAILAYVMGYRELHLYGFDSCYGPTHHAYPQPLNDNERQLNVTVGEETFLCAPWMAQQATEFGMVAPELVRMGCEIHVHGYGLIPTLAGGMERPRIAADERAEAIMERLPDGPLAGAEIGVFAGDLSRRLLQRKDLSLYMIDAWAGNGDSYEGDSGDFHATLTQEQQDACMQLTRDVTAFAGDRAHIIKVFSHEAAASFADGSLDFVFIDADHGYEGCKRDLYAWWPKVKRGGLFSGHDYENTDFPKFGVTRAVTEFAQEHDVPVELGANYTWFVQRP